MDLKTLIADANKALDAINKAEPLINAGIGALAPQFLPLALEIEKGEKLAADYLSNLAKVKAGFSEAEWAAFVASKDADDAAIANLPG